MTKPEKDGGSPGAGRRPLDGLAQRLGALEESLTVVASELGVSAMPRFKRLDPENVYKEAIRRASDVAEPLRIALRKLEARLDDVALAQAQIRRELEAERRSTESADAMAVLEENVAAMAARLDATIAPVERNVEALRGLDDSVANLGARLDTIWQRLEKPVQESDGSPGFQPSPQPLDQRLAAVELRLETLANAATAEKSGERAVMTDPTMTPSGIERRLSILRQELSNELERRLTPSVGSSAAPPVPPIDPATIEAEVARQLQTLIAEAALAGVDTPLPAGERKGARASEVNPLVVGATERAIVRLTHRLEKLEEWRQSRSSDGDAPRGGRGIMGRLFES